MNKIAISSAVIAISVLAFWSLNNSRGINGKWKYAGSKLATTTIEISGSKGTISGTTKIRQLLVDGRCITSDVHYDEKFIIIKDDRMFKMQFKSIPLVDGRLFNNNSKIVKNSAVVEMNIFAEQTERNTLVLHGSEEYLFKKGT